jgi:hypothetical protein
VGGALPNTSVALEQAQSALILLQEQLFSMVLAPLRTTGNTFDLVSTQLDKLHELLGNSDDEEEPVASIAPRILTGGACYLLRHASVLHCQVVSGSLSPNDVHHRDA